MGTVTIIDRSQTLSRATTTYGYDHNGNRVRKTVGTTTTYYPSNLSEIRSSSTTKHIYGGEVLIATIEGSGTTTSVYHNHLDHLESTRAVTDGDGYLTQVLDYYPFGNARIEETYGNTSQDIQYVGTRHDEETDLNYMGARYYGGDWGQFISQDPVSLALGDWKTVQEKTGNKLGFYLQNPQTHNSYSYTANNPLKNKDVNGEFLDTVVDVAFIAYDLYKVGEAYATGGDVKAELGYLGLDVAGAATPFATGFGVAGRLAAKGGDEFIQGGAKAVQINNALSAAQKSQVLKDANLKVGYHTAKRMVERNVSLNAIESAVKSGDKFNYFHEGVNKVGYYDSSSKVFVGSVNGKITTTISNASEGYVKNLKDNKPR